MKQILLIFLCLLGTQQLLAQVDTTSTEVMTDTATTVRIDTNITDVSKTIFSRPSKEDRKKIRKEFQPVPKKAGMYSSILPGLGQIYNRQYWKLPLVYGILGTAGYFIKFNYDEYIRFRTAYIYSIDGDPLTNSAESSNYEASDLKSLQDYYRKNLDIIVLLTGVGYSLQIIDAVTSAHLRNFDISPDISMQMKPVLQSNYVGVGFVFNFK